MPTLVFNFEDGSIPSAEVKDAGSGFSILEITESNAVHLKHNYGGVCAFNSRNIYIEDGDEYSEKISDKEENFIDLDINPGCGSHHELPMYYLER